MGRSCPNAVCHQRHSNPNNQPLCAPCQLQPSRGWRLGNNNGRGEQWGLFPATPRRGRRQPRGAAVGTSNEPQTSGRSGVPVRRCPLGWPRAGAEGCWVLPDPWCCFLCFCREPPPCCSDGVYGVLGGKEGQGWCDQGSAALAAMWVPAGTHCRCAWRRFGGFYDLPSS